MSVVDKRDDPQRTERFPAAVTQAAHNAVRVNVPTAQTTPARPTQQTSKSNSIVLKILIGIAAVAVFVVIAAAGLLGVFYYLGSRQGTVVSTQTPTPAPSVSPSASPYEIVLGPNDDSKKLEDQLKELQKKLDEVSGTNSGGDIPWDPDDLPSVRTAKVNSPKDGFLALRNLPSTEIGSLLVKIPHGTTIKVLICSEQTVSIGGRNGHWCMVSYDEKTGWVFDVWLTFASKAD